MTIDWAAAIKRAAGRDWPRPAGPVVVSPELYDMAVERGYPPESMVKDKPVTLTATIAHYYVPPGPSHWDDLAPMLHEMMINAVAHYQQQAVDQLIGDLDNWQPTGILAALDHADTNTTASMLPDWASQQRPE